MLQKNDKDNPIHLVWGISKETQKPAVLITAYRPSDEKWSDNYTRRKNVQ